MNAEGSKGFRLRVSRFLGFGLRAFSGCGSWHLAFELEFAGWGFEAFGLRRQLQEMCSQSFAGVRVGAYGFRVQWFGFLQLWIRKIIRGSLKQPQGMYNSAQQVRSFTPCKQDSAV